MEQTTPQNTKDEQKDLNDASRVLEINFNDKNSDKIIGLAKEVIKCCTEFDGSPVVFKIIDSEDSKNITPLKIIKKDGILTDIKTPSRVGHASQTIEVIKENLDLVESEIMKIHVIVWGYFFAISIKRHPESIAFLEADRNSFECLVSNNILKRESMAEFVTNLQNILIYDTKETFARIKQVVKLIDNFKRNEQKCI